MREPYLEVAFRHRRPLAVYYYLPRRNDEKSHRTERAALGVIIDYAEDGRPIGLEFTIPANVTVGGLNEIFWRPG
jgi:hypothetical protein